MTGRLGDTPRGGPVHSFYLPRGTARRPVIARAEGLYLWDTEGRRYLDGSSGPVVSNLGHGNRRVLDAMQAQAERATVAYPGLFERARPTWRWPTSSASWPGPAWSARSSSPAARRRRRHWPRDWPHELAARGVLA